MPSDVDLLLVTPPSRLQVYQQLTNEFAAIEPPVWSGLIAEHIKHNGLKVIILDAEAENLTHEQTAEAILQTNAVLTVFVIYWATTFCLNALHARRKKSCRNCSKRIQFTDHGYGNSCFSPPTEDFNGRALYICLPRRRG